MAGDLGDLVARLKVDTSSLDAAVLKVHSFGGAMKTGLEVVAAAVAAVVVGSIDLAAKYQTATDLMAAQSGITADQAKKIGDAFLTTGGKVTFSAQTIMAAFAPVSGQLALAEGHALGAKEALTVMSAAMNLAESIGQPLADVTSALANVMLAYHINVAGAAGASDILFNVSTRLHIPVSTLADSFDKLKYKLGPLAPTLGDVAALLVDLGSHGGPTGSRGLLLVSTAFNTLLGTSKGARDEIAKLGLHVFDASGSFVGMGSIIGRLAPKLAGMTEAQRLLAEKELFGSGASKALDATILAGISAYDKAKAAADKLGTAHVAAKTATDTMKGAFDKLKGAVVDAGIKLGQQFLPAVTIVFNWLTSIMPGVVTVLGNVMTFVGGVFNTIGTWMKQNQTTINSVLKFIGDAFNATWIRIKVVVPIIVEVFNVMGHVIGTIISIIVAVIENIVGVLQKIISWSGWSVINAIFGRVFSVAAGGIGFAVNIVVAVIKAVVTVLAAILSWSGWGTIGGLFKTIFGAIGDAISAVVGFIADIVTGIKDVITWLGNLGGAATSTGPRSPGQPNSNPIIGRRATGGPVLAGASYLVGEFRPEIFRPNVSGTIIPSVGAGGHSITQNNVINLGAGADRSLIPLVEAAIGRSNAQLLASLQAGRR